MLLLYYIISPIPEPFIFFSMLYNCATCYYDLCDCHIWYHITFFVWIQNNENENETQNKIK